MLQERPGRAKRLQERPQARQEWAWVAAEPQEKQAAVELQEMRAVAQPPEAKVSGVAKPPPRVAEPPQPWMGSLAQPPWDAPVQCMPPNLPASCALVAWQPPLPPPRWPHLFLGGPPLPPLLLPGAGKPALCPSWLGVATPPVWWAPYPGPQAGGWPSPSHLVTWTTRPNSSCCKQSCWQCRCLFRPILQWGAPPPYLHLCPPLLSSTSSSMGIHSSYTCTPSQPGDDQVCSSSGVHWSCTPQGQPPLHTSAHHTLHNLGTSSLVCHLGMA